MAASKPTTVILAGNYWDGLAAQPLGSSEILVVDGKIAEVGKKVARPEGAQIIDLSKHFVMPGFIDCHLHLTGNSTIIANFAAMNDAALTLAGVNACETLLHNGFTTVRDAGDFSIVSWITPVLRTAIESGAIRGPRIVSGGHMLSAVGGHFDFGGQTRNGIGIEQVSVVEGVDGLRRAVHDEVRHGVDWIKFAGSGGFMSPSDGPEDISYSQEEMNAIVAAAQGLGKPVFVHAYGDKSVRMAAQADVRSVEHGSLSSVATLDMLAKKGIYLVPTQLAVVHNARETCQGHINMKDPEWARAKDIKYCGALLECAKNVGKSSVKIAFGTDLGTFDYTTNGAKEFSEMVTNGITPLRALKAGTSIAAELLELNTGCIAPGKNADIVAMPGNPFEDISVTEKVRFVMKNGVVYRDDH
jgi:tryptophan 2-monooxygenase